MNDLNRHTDQVIERDFIDSESAYASGDTTISGLIPKILRRWYIVLAIFLVISLCGVPAIWLLTKPAYNVTGAIRVAPILTNVLSGEADRGKLGVIDTFMNTQAQIITSNRIVQGVSDDLVSKDMQFFKDPARSIEYKLKQMIKGVKAKPEISAILKQAISDGIITAQTRKRTELIEISMAGPDQTEAQQIVNSFIREYMAVEVLSSTKDEDQNLTILKDEQGIVAEKMLELRGDIHDLAQEYGDTKLDTRHQMKLDRIATLFASLTQFEADRILLEVKVKLLEENESDETIGPEELLQARNQYINSDPTVSSLVANIEILEQELIVARQFLTPTNPEIKRKVEQVEILSKRMETLKDNAGKTYDKLLEERKARTANADLEKAHAELDATKVYEQNFRDILSKEDIETIGLGRKQLTIEKLENQLSFAEEHYANVTRRITDLELERKRPARISVAYNAEVVSVTDKRLKLTIAIVFGAMACGVGVAFLMSKADKSMYAPNEITKSVSIHIIGTTTCIDRVDKSLLPRLLIEDYQTIRANINMLFNNGEQAPKVLIVTSPCSGDGKTTLSINLATSMARSGKKVLLIDGDMRKPDIANLLNLPKGSRGLQDYLFGKGLEETVCRMPSITLDVLASDSRNTVDAYELLASSLAPQYISSACDHYDHVIIDTPPVLAFPDALLWAKMADAAILASFAGQTTGHDLRETTERLAQINIKVLGTVMNNVRAGNGYNQYGYNYYSQRANASRNKKRSSVGIHLLAAHKEDNSSQS